MQPFKESLKERRRGSITHDDLEQFRKEMNESIDGLKKVFFECQEKLEIGLLGAQEGYRKLGDKYAECSKRFSEIEQRVIFAAKNGDDRLNDHESRLADLELFRAEMRELKHEMNSFKGMLKHTVDSVSSMSSQFGMMSSQVNNIHDMVNALAKKAISTPPAVPKSIKSKIPWQAWPAISVGILLSVALVTGQLSDVLEILKNSQKI